MAEYDHIGTSYVSTRQTEPRIAAQIESALDDAQSVLNVGAGTGSYEAPGRRVVAVEPSRVMIGQRPSGTAPAVQAVAQQLPFRHRSFDAAMAVLTVQHWSDPGQRVVVLTWQAKWESFWLCSYSFIHGTRSAPSNPAQRVRGHSGKR